MRGSVRVASALVLGATSFVALAVRAEPPVAAHAAAASRTEVVLGTLGLEDDSAHASLVRLLAAELLRTGLSLVETKPQAPLSAWAGAVASSERVLVVLLLDARREEGWRLVTIDAARGRAIARELPGGLSRDAASIEAVTNIAVSAALALREGLEIASAPLASVVGDPTPPEVSTVETEKKRPVRRLAPAGWQAFAAVGANFASLSPAAPTTAGISLSVSVRLHAIAEARLVGSAFSPTKLVGPLGRFRIARSWIGAATGPVLGLQSFTLTPEAGILAERLQRFDAAPGAAVLATPAAALYRVGGLAALRLRLALPRPFSAEIVAGAVYFGRRVRFSARSAESSWSVDVGAAQAFAQLGLELALD